MTLEVSAQKTRIRATWGLLTMMEREIGFLIWSAVCRSQVENIVVRTSLLLFAKCELTLRNSRKLCTALCDSAKGSQQKEVYFIPWHCQFILQCNSLTTVTHQHHDNYHCLRHHPPSPLSSLQLLPTSLVTIIFYLWATLPQIVSANNLPMYFSISCS